MLLQLERSGYSANNEKKFKNPYGNNNKIPCPKVFSCMFSLSNNNPRILLKLFTIYINFKIQKTKHFLVFLMDLHAFQRYLMPVFIESEYKRFLFIVFLSRDHAFLEKFLIFMAIQKGNSITCKAMSNFL